VISDAIVVDDSAESIAETPAVEASDEAIADVDNVDLTPDNEASPDEDVKPEA
jgi:hypothetical protein